MSIASQLTALANNRDAIKAAIEAKSPATAPTNALSSFPAAIASIPSGGGAWVKRTLKKDGKHHIYIDWPNQNVGKDFCLGAYYNGTGATLTIEWGDGTSVTDSRASGSSSGYFYHAYASAGIYEIVISAPTDDTYRLDSGGVFCGNTASDGTTLYAYSSQCVKQIEWGSVTKTFGFMRVPYLPCLEYMDWPDTATSIPSSALIWGTDINRTNFMLRELCPPLLSFTTGRLNSNSRALVRCVVPEGYTGSGSVNVPVVDAAMMLEYYELPSSISGTIGPVTCVGANTANGCTLVMKSLTPPTTTRIWTCKFAKIQVPASAVEDYKVATNWSQFASIIEAIPSV